MNIKKTNSVIKLILWFSIEITYFIKTKMAKMSSLHFFVVIQALIFPFHSFHSMFVTNTLQIIFKSYGTVNFFWIKIMIRSCLCSQQMINFDSFPDQPLAWLSPISGCHLVAADGCCLLRGRSSRSRWGPEKCVILQFCWLQWALSSCVHKLVKKSIDIKQEHHRVHKFHRCECLFIYYRLARWHTGSQ